MEKIELNDKIELTNQEKEVYRTLRTNLEFTGVENRVIAITSCTRDDGKSTVTYNLARALAQAGKNTVHIDADMRKSVLAGRLGLQGIDKGLSHYLSGQAQMSEIIYATNKKNFFMLPCGVFPTNPTELLGNARLETLLTRLKNTFDYVLIDTPPLGLVIDAAVISKACDGSVLVLAANKSSKTLARTVSTQLKTANPNLIGVVLNKVEVRKGSYYKKKYGNYYGKQYNAYY